MSDAATRFARLAIVLAAAAVAALAGVALFWWLPDSLLELVGVLLALSVALLGLRVGSSIASSLFPDYDVAEVGVEGPIVREQGDGSPLPSSPTAASADEIADQIERADEDDAADALLLYPSTPGGEVVPGEDVRDAAAAFDGPTVAYTTDLCASGGTWIASGCDELWPARAASSARSASCSPRRASTSSPTTVGLAGARPTRSASLGSADRHGISYERIVSGDYKDATGAPFKEMEPEEREYVQSLSDAWYEQFVDRVAEGWELDPADVRDTEARVSLGTDGADVGIVDELGDRDAIETQLAERLDRPEVTVERFEPDRSLPERLQGGAAGLAYAFGAGVANVVAGDGPELR